MPDAAAESSQVFKELISFSKQVQGVTHNVIKACNTSCFGTTAIEHIFKKGAVNE